MTPNLETHEGFTSRYLRPPHSLAVLLPPGYARSERRYPVLYLQDGQNLFDPALAFGGQEWGVDETAGALIHQGAIEPLIVVGVYNAGVARIAEYTASQDAGLGQGGRADLYGRMLIDEVKPFIDARYRTLRHAANTGLGGSSLGGLVSLLLGLRYPKVFGRLAILSPSVWWDNRSVLKMVAAHGGKPRPRIWLDIGTAEGARTLEDARALREALLRQGWSEGADLAYLEAEGAGHNERAWAARVGPMLRYLFPPVAAPL